VCTCTKYAPGKTKINHDAGIRFSGKRTAFADVNAVRCLGLTLNAPNEGEFYA
jgi:hypothetical protein